MSDTDRWEPVPVPQGNEWHDIGDDARAAIVRRLMDDWRRDPDLTPEKVRQLATWAGASVRALLHELGTLRDLAGESHYIPERDGRRCVEHPTADHELICLTCLESPAAPPPWQPMDEIVEEFVGWWSLNREVSVNRTYDYIDKMTKRLRAALPSPPASAPQPKEE